MRIWHEKIIPKLCRQHLLAVWREGLGCYKIISDETGHTSRELHELFKRLFIPPVYKTILGVEMKMPGSSTELSKPDFGEYLDRICAHTNVPLPDPELFP